MLDFNNNTGYGFATYDDTTDPTIDLNTILSPSLAALDAKPCCFNRFSREHTFHSHDEMHTHLHRHYHDNIDLCAGGKCEIHPPAVTTPTPDTTTPSSRSIAKRAATPAA